jgi:glycosyltransferase involved in cell wall biosynthesis
METAMSAPLVSIVIPIYNSEYYIRETIVSILNQSYNNWELLCIDDGSTDESASIVQSFQDDRIRYIRNEKNSGIAYSRNRGIHEAKGELIAFLDSDDLAHPERLQRQVERITQDPSIDVIFTRIQQIDVYGNPAGRWLEDEMYVTEQSIKENLPYVNCLAQPTAFGKKKVFIEFPYRSEYRDSEDYALWLELLIAGKRLVKIDEALTYYRIRPSSETQRSIKDPITKDIRFRETFCALMRENPNAQGIISIHEKIIRTQKINALKEKYIKKPVHSILKVIRANPFALVIKLIQLYLFLQKNKEKKYAFFIPFYHIGGAEKVHLSIINSFKHSDNIVFFTKTSGERGYWNEFNSHASCIDIGKLAWYPFFKKITGKMIVNFVNHSKIKTAISSNSIFFYENVKAFSSDIRCIDLMHAFVHPEESGPEKWSLPVVSRLDKRIIIGEKTRRDFEEFYRKNNVDAQYLQRIELIRNYVHIPDDVHIHQESPIKLIYIGRGTPEKRVNLAARIAQNAREFHRTEAITMIGDIEHAINLELKKSCTFKGIIRNEKEVMNCLLQHDILLLTSSREGMPMAVVEAMACGVIPIVTAVGDLPNVIHHGVNGFLLPVENETLIVENTISIIKDLGNDLNKRNEIARAARHTAKELFAEERFRKMWQQTIAINE